MIVPKPLKKGDTIGIVAPSGPLEAKVLLLGEQFLIESGYRVVIAPSCFEKQGYLAGASDEQRAQDLMMLFADADIDAILCMRGGYGSNRLLPYIKDFNFSEYPKIFIGFSDITYLHIFLNQKHQLMTFHGPMISDLIRRNDETNQHFFEVLSGNYLIKMTNLNYYNEQHQPVEGEIVGGNLSIICSTLATPYEINTKGKILFIEEVNEPVYVIDRLLMQLKLSHKLDDAAGIILGDFNVFDKEKTEKLLRQMFKLSPIPVAFFIPTGHCLPHYILPLGAPAILNPAQKTLRIIH